MDQQQVNELLRQHLGTHADRRGWVLYSGIDTLTSGDFYLLGFNPRQDPANRPLLSASGGSCGWSAYVHQCWKCSEVNCTHIDPNTARLRNGQEEPHQRRVSQLLHWLGASPERIFATNAIFVESPKANDLEPLRDLWDRCWMVHLEWLRLVQPRWIICLGNGAGRSPFELLRRRARGTPAPLFVNRERSDYRDGKWFSGEFIIGDAEPLRAKVLGLPHPSRIPFRLTPQLKSLLAPATDSPTDAAALRQC